MVDESSPFFLIPRMNRVEYRDHWEQVFQTKDTRQVSWYQEVPIQSLTLIERFCTPGASIIEVGGGDSRLPDELLLRGYENITVLDISNTALEVTRNRLGERSNLVHWIVSNVLDLKVDRTFDVWHDRAVFHFLNTVEDQEVYKDRLVNHLTIDGMAIIGGFSANDGPFKCSGLEVARHDRSSMTDLFSPEFEIVESFEAVHTTPSGGSQNFQWTILRFGGLGDE